jgi:hypothetical protein
MFGVVAIIAALCQYLQAEHQPMSIPLPPTRAHHFKIVQIIDNSLVILVTLYKNASVMIILNTSET